MDEDDKTDYLKIKLCEDRRFVQVNSKGKTFQNNPHHCVLIIDFNDNNRRVDSQFTGLSKQLYVLKDQQLVPSGAKSLSQHLAKEQNILDEVESTVQ